MYGRVALVELAVVVAAATAAVVPPTATGTPPSPLVTRLDGVGDATQVISVTNQTDGWSRATVRAFQKTATGWHQVRGPWHAWIGRRGFARPSAKREGDGKTPTGSYPFAFFFGVDPNPGVRFPWRHAWRSDYWDDDPASPRYNTWVDTTHHNAGRNPEPMHVQPSYDDVAVIGYNPDRTPGRGSAIFLHVTHNSPTSGCVALPRDHVLTLLRWLNPADHPRIIMGELSAVTR